MKKEPGRSMFLNEQTAAYEPMGHCACEGTEERFAEYIRDAFREYGFSVRVDSVEYRLHVEAGAGNE